MLSYYLLETFAFNALLLGVSVLLFHFFSSDEDCCVCRVSKPKHKETTEAFSSSEAEDNTSLFPDPNLNEEAALAQTIEGDNELVVLGNSLNLSPLKKTTEKESQPPLSISNSVLIEDFFSPVSQETEDVSDSEGSSEKLETGSLPAESDTLMEKELANIDEAEIQSAPSEEPFSDEDYVYIKSSSSSETQQEVFVREGSDVDGEEKQTPIVLEGEAVNEGQLSCEKILEVEDNDKTEEEEVPVQIEDEERESIQAAGSESNETDQNEKVSFMEAPSQAQETGFIQEEGADTAAEESQTEANQARTEADEATPEVKEEAESRSEEAKTEDTGVTENAVQASSNEDPRYYIASELLETEIEYGKRLHLAMEIYYAELLPYLSKVEMQNIFSVLNMIQMLQVKIEQQLRDRIAETAWSGTTTLGDLFTGPLTEVFKSYVPYANNYSFAVKAIDTLLQKKEFKKIMQKCQALPEVQYLDLKSLLIAPIQRIPRYILLLEDLKRKTPAAHPDSAHLQAALEKLKNIADHINEKKRDHENMLAVARVQNELISVSDLVEPTRLFVAEAFVTLEDKDEGKLYLFTDMILIAKEKKKGRYKVADQYYLSDLNMALLDLPERGTTLSIANQNGDGVDVNFATPAVRAEFLRNICQGVENLQRKRESFVTAGGQGDEGKSTEEKTFIPKKSKRRSIVGRHSGKYSPVVLPNDDTLSEEASYEATETTVENTPEEKAREEGHKEKEMQEEENTESELVNVKNEEEEEEEEEEKSGEGEEEKEAEKEKEDEDEESEREDEAENEREEKEEAGQGVF